MARILMLVATAVANDSRVRREAEALVAAGHSVHIIGKDVPEEFVPPVGITVSSVGASSPFRSAGSGRPLSLPLRFGRWLMLPRHRNAVFSSWSRGAVADGRVRDYDVVHAHDFTALEAAAELAANRGVPYVYDSHELWLGRQRQYRPTPLQDMRELRIERDIGGRAALVITVSDGVAAALARAYGWSDVVVVRNSFPPADDDPTALFAPTGLAYVGRIDGQRELETVLRAAASLPDLPLRLVGPVDEAWVMAHRADLDAVGAKLEPAVDLETATQVLREVGLSLVTLTAGPQNHRVALPNKLFHAIQAGVPVIAADLPELARAVRGYDIGELYRPGDDAGFVAAVRHAQARYPQLVENVRNSRSEMSWPADAATLTARYSGYPWGRPVPEARPGDADSEGP